MIIGAALKLRSRQPNEADRLNVQDLQNLQTPYSPLLRRKVVYHTSLLNSRRQSTEPPCRKVQQRTPLYTPRRQENQVWGQRRPHPGELGRNLSKGKGARRGSGGRTENSLDA